MPPLTPISPLTSRAQGEGHKQGPNLNGLFGRVAGTAADYSYSAANKGSGAFGPRVGDGGAQWACARLRGEGGGLFLCVCGRPRAL